MQSNYFSSRCMPVSIPGTHKNAGTTLWINVENADFFAIKDTAIPTSSTCGAKSVGFIFLSTFL